MNPQTAPATPLDRFCGSIRDYEGAPGDANYINNNPGNCRFYSGGYLPEYGVVKESPAGFAVFPTWEQGWMYLENLVKEKVGNHPQWTIEQFFANYAPTSDGNNPTLYAGFVARRMGVEISAVVKTVLNI